MNMKEKNSKFHALTPEILDENKQIYTEALDYAFSNSDIKNIAITGIYGAGKSTVWKTYVNKRSMDNIITVSLGKYEDNSLVDSSNTNYIKEDNQILDKTNSYKNNSTENIKNEDAVLNNRIERQIINQILSQVNESNIPLSKYKFKNNKSKCSIYFNIITIISFLLAIGAWVFKDLLLLLLSNYSIGIESYLTISTILFLYPVFYFTYKFIKYNSLHISKINLKGAEANFNEIIDKEETILEKDMKEIVYLLNSSNAEIVVFEDLDRYENIEIYTKLRELNFLLNSFISATYNGKKKNVKFVYMLRDGLFVSKNRVKFFDFIVPIVPVIDSKSSENKLIEALKVATNIPNQNVITNIALYIDDMRLLKNILNEYLIYENIVAIKELELNANKLFSLIVLKNIFPREFDLLQENQGYIFNIFAKINGYKSKLRKKLECNLKEVDEELIKLNNSHENKRYEIMASMIPPNIRLSSYDNSKSWTEFLKKQSSNPEENFRINYVYSMNNTDYNTYNYETFVQKYILINQERIDLIDKLSIDIKSRINELSKNKSSFEKDIKRISLRTVKEQLKLMLPDEINQIFSENKSKITENHYFPLIRFLIINGLLDETYWHYKGVFYKGSLGKNDTIFIKNLLEAKEQDIFLDIENPNEVERRLNIEDFHKFNILNNKLLENCINLNSEKSVLSIMESVNENNNYKLLIKILDTYSDDVIKKFVVLIINNRIEHLIKILKECDSDETRTFYNVLTSIFTIHNIKAITLKIFRDFIEKKEVIVSMIGDQEFENFIDNINKVEIKFDNISKCESSIDRLKKIEAVQAYKLNIDNVSYIVKKIIGKEIAYGSLISTIYNNKHFIKTKEYIKENFEEFISLYIDGNSQNKDYTNEEDIVIKIINSNLSMDYKNKYIGLNDTIISNVGEINNLENNISLVEILFDKNTILFNSNNINLYFSVIKEYNNKFTNFFDKNINDENYEEILKENKNISNIFINSSIVTDKVFNYAIKCADNKISHLRENISNNRIKQLIDFDLIEINDTNLEILVQKQYYEEILLLITSKDVTTQDEIINLLLDLEITKELVYQLINNSNISDGSSILLINQIIDEVEIEKICRSKKTVIKYLIENNLSENNINYISKNFREFEFKEEFIKYVEENDKFKTIKIENLTTPFLESVFNHSTISTDSKIDLIVMKIINKSSINELIKLISSVEEISDLVNVWKEKRPALNNAHKVKIGNALIKVGYVSKRNDRDCVRIMKRNSHI